MLGITGSSGIVGSTLGMLGSMLGITGSSGIVGSILGIFGSMLGITGSSGIVGSILGIFGSMLGITGSSGIVGSTLGTLGSMLGITGSSDIVGSTLGTLGSMLGITGSSSVVGSILGTLGSMLGITGASGIVGSTLGTLGSMLGITGASGIVDSILVTLGSMLGITGSSGIVDSILGTLGSMFWAVCVSVEVLVFMLLKKFSKLKSLWLLVCGFGSSSKKLKNFPCGSKDEGFSVGGVSSAAVDFNNSSILATGFSWGVISWAVCSILSISINPGNLVVSILLNSMSGIWTTSSGAVFSKFKLLFILSFNILSISSSVFLTVNRSLIILFNISTCCFSSFNFNKDLAWRSEILFSNKASWTSSLKFNNLSVFAIEDWDLPTFWAKSSWLIYPISNIFLYEIAFSIGVKSSLWTFSIKAISTLSLSVISETIAGIVCLPAITLALYLLSPAIISYLSPIFLTTIGWMTPYFLIDRANSLIEFSSNLILGWNLFGKTSAIFNSTTFFSFCTKKTPS